MSTEDRRFMRRALAVATADGDDPSLSPIGSVIVQHGRIVAAARNCVVEHHDPTAHAEMVAIRAACAELETEELRGATLYSTLQPCGMCTMATIWSKIGRVVYGAGRDDVHAMYFEDRHIDTLSFIADAYREDIVIRGGVLRAACKRLYYGPDDNVPLDEQGNR
jgi:tRNA(adenine34) deaminase